jgi:hypothetical protein
MPGFSAMSQTATRWAGIERNLAESNRHFKPGPPQLRCKATLPKVFAPAGNTLERDAEKTTLAGAIDAAKACDPCDRKKVV